MELREQLDLDTLLTVMEQSIQQEIPNLSIHQLFENLLNGTFDFDIVAFIEQMMAPIYQEVTMQCSFLGQMILLAVVYALLPEK